MGCFKLKVYTTGWYHIIVYVCVCACMLVCVSVYVCLLNPFLDKLLSPAVTLLRINDSAPFTLPVLPTHKHKQLWRVMGCRLVAACLAIFNIGTQARNMRDNSLERFILSPFLNISLKGKQAKLGFLPSVTEVRQHEGPHKTCSMLASN